MTADAEGPRPRRRGRPARTTEPAGPDARARILEAARTEFAERGYDKASVRGIARAAGVDAALVHHYFGTKEEVFAAAVEISFEPALVVPAILGDGADGVGERLARYFISVWESPASRAPLLAILRSALNHEAAAKVLRGFVLRRLLERIAERLDVPDATFRAELAASHMVGIAMLRYVIRAEPLASADPEKIIELVAPTLQRYLTDNPSPSADPDRPGISSPSADPDRPGISSPSADPDRPGISSPSADPDRPGISSPSADPDRPGISSPSADPDRPGISSPSGD